MGARINYLFNQGAEEPAVWLYSHWGETDWQKDIALALQHSRSRLDGQFIACLYETLL